MIELAIILAALIALGTAVIITFMVYQAIRYVPYVPTDRKTVRKMVEVAKIQPGEKVYDLGCGDARLLIEASRHQQIEATGVEVSWPVMMLARCNAWIYKKPVQLLRKNFFDVDLSNADVVFCYLFPKVMKRLDEKFRKELQPGARVISYCFPMEGWNASSATPTKKEKPKNFLIFRYDIPQSYE